MTPLYKTIVLRLLEERPELYRRLREERSLLATLDLYAAELKASHEDWKESLPEGEALERALKELAEALPPASDAP